jgi:hypothetical protein
MSKKPQHFLKRSFADVVKEKFGREEITEGKKKNFKQFWIIFFKKSQPPPFPVKWSVPNKM